MLAAVTGLGSTTVNSREGYSETFAPRIGNVREGSEAAIRTNLDRRGLYAGTKKKSQVTHHRRMR